jgi:hypothetical protein
MNRCSLLCLVLGLGFASVGMGGIRTNHFTVSRQRKTDTTRYEYVGVVAGKLVPGQSRFATYDEEEPNHWFVVDGKIKAGAGGYLAYDVSGKDNAVFLTPRAGEGTQWIITPITRGREEERGEVQAAAGPFKGWRLDVEEREEKAEGGEGKTVTVRRHLLKKDPPRPFQVWRVYEHK